MIKRSAAAWATWVALSGSACSVDDFLQLPDDPDAESWLLLAGSRADIFDATGSVTADPDARLRLASLPVSTAELGGSPIDLDGDRRVSVSRSFEYEDGTWTETAALTITTAFDRDACAGQCLRTFTCETCMVKTTQGCGPCTPNPVTPPTLPTKDCPTGWLSETFEDGHYQCFMPKPDGYAAPCPVGSRWSQVDAACVAMDCAPPALPPSMLNVTYVDTFAMNPGNGSEAQPFAEVPTATVSGVLVLRPGTYPRVNVRSVGLQVMGHGPCTHIDELHVNTADVEVEGVSLGMVTLTASATATITASVISAPHVPLEAWGAIRLVDTRVEATAELGASIVAHADMSIIGGDIAGTVESEGQLAVSDTRILSDADLGGAPALVYSGLRLDAVNSTFIGSTAVYVKVGDAVLQDVVLESYSSDNQALLMEGDSLVLERADVHAGRVGVELEGGRAEIVDLRVTAERGVFGSERVPGASLNFRRGWIDGARSGVYYRSDVELFDLWLRRLGDGTVLKSGVIDTAENRLEANRIQILGYGHSALEATGSVDITDLTASGRMGLLMIEEVGTSRKLIAKRWSIEAVDVGVTLPLQWDLEDVVFAARPDAVAFVPVCARDRTTDSSRMTRFSLTPSPGVPSIVLDEFGAELTFRVIDGRLFAPVVAYGDLCRGSFEAFEDEGWFDQVTVANQP